MKKIIIFGNSGSGKSTLAKSISRELELAHLDLDLIAWTKTVPPTRKSLNDSNKEIKKFLSKNEGWIIEGCYSDLIKLVLDYSTEIIYLDLPVSKCIDNAISRPWEPHKYPSKKAQDDNLEMLIEWIRAYETRSDTFSKFAHDDLYNQYLGKKRVISSNCSSKKGV